MLQLTHNQMSHQHIVVARMLPDIHMMHRSEEVEAEEREKTNYNV